MFIKRGVQGVKEIVGVSKKTEDMEVDTTRSTLTTLTKQLKKMNSSFNKLPNMTRNPNNGHVQAMKDASEILEEGNCFSQCHDVFETIDMKSHCYGLKLKEEVLDPIAKFIDICSVLDKRMKALSQRRIDMDAAHGKYESISKKPPNKQTGLLEAERNYNDLRDYYEYFRNEVVEDCNRSIQTIKTSLPQICANCMKGYTDYINDLNETWSSVPTIISAIGEVPLDFEPPYTPTDRSMCNIENVKIKKSEDSTGGFGQSPTVTAYSSLEPTAPTSQAPPVPTSGKTVTAIYDYTAVEEGELSFNEGDVITVIEQTGDWWIGEVNGKKRTIPIKLRTTVMTIMV
ncbi:Endophilin-A2 [Entamoeba marina]